MNSPKYQVALSFAGEQRDYVEEVARNLQCRSINVFYDSFEEVSLWGRSGTEAFDEVFGRQSTYVVMFISAAYVSKAWPRHERRSALGRMVREQGEYILPVRFDNTPVPGLPRDILYRCAREYTPAQLAQMIACKLGMRSFASKASQRPPPRTTSPTGEVVFDYSSFNGSYVIGSGMLEFETKWTKASDTRIHVYNDPPSINGIALARGCKSISQVKNAASLDYTSRIRTPCLGQILVLRNTQGFYAALQVLGIKDDSRRDNRDEIRFRYAIQSHGSADFTEFVDERRAAKVIRLTAPPKARRPVGSAAILDIEMSRDQSEQAGLPPPFFEWVTTRQAADNPRGDFIRDTRMLLKLESSEADLRTKLIMQGCEEAKKECRKLEAEYRRQFRVDPSDLNYKHRREQAVGLSWYEIRWRVLPYVVYICRNGHIVLGNRRYLPLWVWEREPQSSVGKPDWKPVNERAFIQGIVMSLHTYSDRHAGLRQVRMISHVNAKLETFRLGGLPPDWKRHRQATDRKAWKALHSPPEDRCEGIILDYD